jgi:hypothetical protein
VARFVDRPPRPRRFTDRRVGADLLARLHHAGGVLRLARLGARPRADRRRPVPAARGHRLHADRRAAGRPMGHVPGRGDTPDPALDRG